MKKKIFFIIPKLTLIILLVLGMIIIKPKYELHHAVNLIKEAKYSEAYIYISNTENEENKKIIKELISMELVDYMTGGIKQIDNIATQGTKIITDANKSNIDYSSDDTLNIYVKKLEDYIEIKNEISKEMILEELSESYDIYFEILEFINANFIDILNRMDDANFRSEVSLMATKLITISVDTTSIQYNYKFSEKTNEILEELSE